MTAHERDRLRERIVSYMEYHPLHIPTPQEHVWSLIFGCNVRYLTTLFRSRTIRFHTMLVGTVALMFVTAVPLIAEHALPGDVLYPVKVRFNEEIRSQLLSSPYEKIQWETERVERRIAEARLLVQEGKLTEEKKHTIEETVRSHATAFQDQLAELRESDAASAAIAEVTVQSALDVQSAVLDSDIAHTASSTALNIEDVGGLAAIVREASADVALSTDTGNTLASYEPLAARLEENTTRIHVLSDDLADKLTAEEKAEIQERTTNIEGTIVVAEKAHATRGDSAAVLALQNALAMTEKLIAFMSDDDLRSSVPLDVLIPLQPSVETLESSLAEMLALVSERQASFIAVIGTIEEPQRTVVVEQLTALGALLEQSSSALKLGRLTETEQLMTEAGALLATLETLLR